MRLGKLSIAKHSWLTIIVAVNIDLPLDSSLVYPVMASCLWPWAVLSEVSSNVRKPSPKSWYESVKYKAL